MPRARVVELLGPPASGKSGIGAELAALSGAVVLKDHEPADLATLAWSAARAVPILRYPPPAGVGRARWIAWAGRLGAAPRVVGRRLDGGASVVLLDQGPAYTLGRLGSLRRRGRAASWWQRAAVDSAGLLDLLVLLDADTGTLTQRLRDRDKTHAAKDLTDDAAASYLDHERRVCRDVAGTLEQAGTTVLRLDTTVTSRSECVAVITAALAVPVTGADGGPR